MRRIYPVVGIVIVGTLLVRGGPAPEVAPPPPPPPPAVAITVPPPLVIHIEKTIEAPPAAIPPATSDLGCPLVTANDEPIGARVDPTADADSEVTAKVFTAARAPQIAVMNEQAVWVSDDDGRTWSRAFDDHEVTHVAVSANGVVFALASYELGVRSPGGRTRWRPIEHDQDYQGRHTNLAVIGSEVIAIIGDQIHASRDQGRSWKHVKTDERAWDDTGTAMFTWRGAAYQIDHYHERCGVSEQHVYRLDAKHRVTGDVFHDYYMPDEPVLRASTDIDTQWAWKPRCWSSETPDNTSACTARAASRYDLLTAATLKPAEGARTLAVYEHGLIELCERGARLVYRTFPFDRVDAVDAAGRALVMRGESLLRWSPLHGWRKLKTFASPRPADPEGA
jgi:hypothetical protein